MVTFLVRRSGQLPTQPIKFLRLTTWNWVLTVIAANCFLKRNLDYLTYNQ